MKQIFFKIDENLYWKFKEKLIKNRTTQTEELIAFIQDYIKDEPETIQSELTTTDEKADRF